MFVHLTASLSLAQPDPALLQRYFEEGEKALAEQRYADAAKAYEKLSELDPGSAELHARLGVIYFQQGRFAEAVSTLRRALKLKPDLPNADVLLAMSLSETGRYNEALPGLEKGSRQKNDPALRRMAGLQLERAYTGLGRDREAVAVALELSRLFPDDPEVLYHTGRLFANFAYLTMVKLSEEAPDSVWTVLAVAEAQEGAGAYDLAIGNYQKVLELDPGRPGIHLRIGRALLARSRKGPPRPEDAGAAVEAFARELEVDPTNANAAYELGVIYHDRGEFGKAHEFFGLALEHYPDFQEAAVGMGRTLLALGKPEPALEHLQRAASLDPNDDVAYFHLARAYRELGNAAEQEKAIATYRDLRMERTRREDTLLQRAVTRQEVAAGDEPPPPARGQSK